MKESARHLWSYKTRGWARRMWTELIIDWMSRSRLQPMVRVSRTLREHLWGIVNTVVLSTTNAVLESVNVKIQKLKKRACGYRNRDRFRTAIFFHCGGLVYPSSLHATRNPEAPTFHLSIDRTKLMQAMTTFVDAIIGGASTRPKAT